MNKELLSCITKACYSKDEIQIVKDFSFLNNKQNQLLLFFKPEVFFPESIYSEKMMEMTLNKLEVYQVEVNGCAVLRGDFIAKHEIMDRHYGFINKVSKNISNIITSEEKEKINNLLSIAAEDNIEILGGHEFLRKYKNFDFQTLNTLWLSKNSVKIRSGFYAGLFEVETKKIVIVNGFHPAQLAHFTNPAHKIVIALLNSDTDWDVLKNDLVGATFPEKAKPTSIRGEIYKNAAKYGAKQVQASLNFVHLSAGAFEALFELNNFLSALAPETFKLDKTNLASKIISKGFTLETVTKALANPTSEIDGRQLDLFSNTEEKNTNNAIQEFYLHYL